MKDTALVIYGDPDDLKRVVHLIETEGPAVMLAGDPYHLDGWIDVDLPATPRSLLSKLLRELRKRG